MDKLCKCVYKTGQHAGERCIRGAKPGSKFCGVHKNCSEEWAPKTKAPRESGLYAAAPYFPIDERKQIIKVVAKYIDSSIPSIIAQVKKVIEIHPEDVAPLKLFVKSIVGHHLLMKKPLGVRTRTYIKKLVLRESVGLTEKQVMNILRAKFGEEYVTANKLAITQLLYTYSMAKEKILKQKDCKLCYGK